MGSTKGDKLFFEGAESCYEISGRNKTLRVNDSPSGILSLKRKEPPPAVFSPSKAKLSEDAPRTPPRYIPHLLFIFYLHFV